MPPDVIDDAITEARRRQSLSDRDVSAQVAHFAAVVRPVCDDWGLTADDWLDGGAGMPVLAVSTARGDEGVLKICQPGTADGAVRVIRAAAGVGYVRVLAWDSCRGALLTERLGADLWAATTSLAEQSEVLVPLLQDAWNVPLAQGIPFTGKASGLLHILGDLGPRYASGHPEALALARRYAGELATTECAEVVCHGDPHPGNVLRRGAGWALIDPDGFVGERAYDLGVVVRDACREIAASEPAAGAELVSSACHRLGELTGVDPDRVWRWGFVERVTTGLYLRWFGYADESATFLDTAVALARSR